MIDDRSDIAGELLQTHHQVIAILAGIEAEKMIIGTAMENTGHDLDEAASISALICRSPSPASIDAYLEYAKQEAAGLLAANASAVVAVAAALTKHRTLSGADIDSIMTGRFKC